MRPSPDLPLRLFLAFDDPEHEDSFLKYYVDIYFRYAQISLIVGLLLLTEDFVVDWFATPDVAANIYRLTLTVPLIAAAIFYLYLPYGRRHWQVAMSVAVLSVGISLLWSLHAIDKDGGMGLQSWVGIMDFTYVEMYCFAILGIRFSYALLPGVLLLAYFLYLLWADAGIGMVGYWVFHILNMFLLAAGIGWWREWLIRKDYVARVTLEEERRNAETLARVKSEFLANMSHEIRTPLNGVLGLAQIGHRGSATLGEARETFARILDSGKHLLAIVNEILDFSKIDAGKLEIELVPISPATLIDDAVNSIGTSAAAKGLRLTKEIGDGLPAACLGDPIRISQVLLNLLSNAVKFTPAGEVRAGIFRDGAELVFRIEDTGIGMAPAAVERLFTPFEQADSSMTRKFGGTGLGLAISRRLADLMGGRLSVRSEVGRGSTFELRLPLRETVQPVVFGATSFQGTGQRLAGIRALVAEDNDMNRLVLSAMLSHEGAHASMVENGREAIEAVEVGAKAFDIVLMDVQMPEVDGLAATRRIKEIAPELPVVGVTAHALTEERVRCRLAGMDEVTCKPVDINELVAAIQRHVTVGRTLDDGASPAPRQDDLSPAPGEGDGTTLGEPYASSPPLLSKVVRGFLECHGDAPRQIRTAAYSDLPGLAKLAHELIGTAGLLLSNRMVAAHAVATETAARTGSPDAPAYAEELARSVEVMLAELRQHVAASSDGGAQGSSEAAETP